MEKLTQELDKLPDNYIVGVVMPADSYEDANLHILDYLVNKKNSTGGYVSISKPSHHIIKQLNEKKISTKDIYFLDCVTKGLGMKNPTLSNGVFIDSPSSLTLLSLELHKFFTSTGEKNRFLYIDSLSTLCIHNKLDSVLRFIHHTTGKMRLFGFNGLMLSVHEGTDRKLIAELGQFCDKVIHL